MRLTTKGRFAVTAMIDVAMHNGKGPVTLAAVSDRQKISLSYLEQLFGKLRRYGLVDSVRGPGGGYNLARDATAVSVADIIEAIDGPLAITACGPADERCEQFSKCNVRDPLWRVTDRIVEVLQTITLSDMARGDAEEPVMLRMGHSDDARGRGRTIDKRSGA